MTTERRLERDLPQILGDLAMGPYPDYIEDVLSTTAQRRQRPAWTFPERWLPMDIVTTRVPTAAFPLRQLGLLALIALLAAAALAVFVGAQTRLPAPFGPAANGLIAYAVEGDIFTLDPVTGVTRAVVTGPESDDGPVFSRDGTRLVFQRKAGAGAPLGTLIVARADGSAIGQVTPEPLADLGFYGFSPNGHSIVAMTRVNGGARIVIAAVDGLSPPRFIDPEMAVEASGPEYRPDGSEIMLVGREHGQAYRGIYAIDAVSGAVRTIVAPALKADIYHATWSPDGSRIAYGIYDPFAENNTSRTHVIAADGTSDVLVDTHPDTIADGTNAGRLDFSNDGTRLFITRVFLRDGVEDHRFAVVPVDGSGLGVELTCPPAGVDGRCATLWRWSPDDTALIGLLTDTSGTRPLQRLLADPLTGATRVVPGPATISADWQRLAP